MNITIFSKDRAAQLELLLRSMKKYFKEWNNYSINVLYTHSDESYKKGYDLTFKKHPEFNYIKESSFKNDLLKSIDPNKQFTTFFVDDNIFKEPFSINDDEFKIFNDSDEILCLSLRLHPNLTYCYPARVVMTKPGENIFDWRGKKGDFGYPMSLDGHIFRTKDIISKLKEINYRNPNSLESGLASNPIHKPLMIMYDKSIIINNPVNKVQNFNQNVHGNISADHINKQYLNGRIISLKNIEGINNISCHQEIPISF